jgi:membrane protein required for colicin V production
MSMRSRRIVFIVREERRRVSAALESSSILGEGLGDGACGRAWGLAPVNWVTVVILVIVGLLTWRAWRNGFVRELVSLAAVVLAIPVAGVFYDDLFPKVQPIVDNHVLAGLASFLAIFLGVVIGGQVVAHLIRQGVAMLNLGAADQLAGAAFGFLKGVFVCQALLIALVVFPEPDLRDDIDQSEAATVLLDGAPLALAILPKVFDTQIDEFLGGVVNGIKGDSDEAATETPTATP